MEASNRRMQLSRTRRLYTTAIAAGALALLAALPAPASAVQVATSTDALGASGMVSPGGAGYDVPCSVLANSACLIPRQIRDVLHPILDPLGFTAPDGTWVPAQPQHLTPNGTEIYFEFEFLDPTVGEMSYTNLSTTPLAESLLTNRDIDLRKPIAKFSARQTGTPGANIYDCDLTLNPTSYSHGVPGVVTPGSPEGARAIDDLWFDVDVSSCKDGLPYDYYRVHLYQDLDWRLGFKSYIDFVDQWRGSVVSGEKAKPAVCGHLPDGGWDCYTGEYGNIFTADELTGTNRKTRHFG